MDHSWTNFTTFKSLLSSPLLPILQLVFFLPLQPPSSSLLLLSLFRFHSLLLMEFLPCLQERREYQPVLLSQVQLHFFVRVKTAGLEVRQIVGFLVSVSRGPLCFHSHSSPLCLRCEFHYHCAQREPGCHQLVDDIPVPSVVCESRDLHS